MPVYNRFYPAYLRARKPYKKVYCCIKPPHLFGLTGERHFRSIIYDAYCCGLPHPVEQRERKDILPIICVLVASAVGISFSYGFLSPRQEGVPLTEQEKKCYQKTITVCEK